MFGSVDVTRVTARAVLLLAVAAGAEFGDARSRAALVEQVANAVGLGSTPKRRYGDRALNDLDRHFGVAVSALS